MNQEIPIRLMPLEILEKATGITQSNWSRMLNGSMLTERQIKRIAKALNMTNAECYRQIEEARQERLLKKQAKKLSEVS
jgi:DNA-binding Lrp family transcriptional regulator